MTTEPELTRLRVATLNMFGTRSRWRQPVGDVLFVNHLPGWQLTREYQRELQTVRVARFIEEWLENRQAHVVVAGDLDATPDAATIRFWTGKQSLDGLSVCYRDAWAALNPDGSAGHTFTTDNDLVRLGDGGVWAQDLGRRIDYVLVRCLAHGPTLRVAACERLFDRPVNGIWGSDHFGVVADLERIG